LANAEQALDAAQPPVAGWKHRPIKESIMRVFVTGATGFIGSAIVRELLDAGHQVLGLARSAAAEAALRAISVEVHRGALDDPDSLRAGAATADGVIHTAFIHDFTDYPAAIQTDRRAIEALGEVLAGSDRPFVVTSGAALTPGRLATEESVPDPGSAGALRFASEEAALSFVPRGVRVSVVRLPPTVHGEGDHGFVPQLIDIARDKGISAYPGDGANRWAAVHRLDAAQLYRLALEEAPAGTRLHGVGEEGVPVRDIAEVIGRHLNLPVASTSDKDHFGFLSMFFAHDIPASSTVTQKLMDWHPARPGLIADLDAGHYF
jgi:nucleoside-diphosphate-sugar epimerase